MQHRRERGLPKMAIWTKKEKKMDTMGLDPNLDGLEESIHPAGFVLHHL
jgi:hypothetical protein